MSTNFHAILFNEAVCNDRFVGFTSGRELVGLPLWGNFSASDVLKVSNIGSIRHTMIPDDRSAQGREILSLLGDAKTPKHILLGRTGNLVFLDWQGFLRQLKKPKGIIKINVGRIPSDLYCIEKGKLRESIVRLLNSKSAGAVDLLKSLFDEVLFDRFERVVKCDGYSFFMRDAYEYYRENLMIVRRLSDGDFIDLYARLEASSAANTVVSDRAYIRNSYLGNGAVVHGQVENSVIFGGVTVGHNSSVRNSVVLPANRIGDGVRIENALILEGKDRSIEHGCSIGGNSRVRNREYPHLLKEGLTIIGEKVSVPARSRIGAGCLVFTSADHGRPEQPKKPFDVSDGGTFRL